MKPLKYLTSRTITRITQVALNLRNYQQQVQGNIYCNLFVTLNNKKCPDFITINLYDWMLNIPLGPANVMQKKDGLGVVNEKESRK